MFSKSNTTIKGHITIRDKKTKEVLVDKDVPNCVVGVIYETVNLYNLKNNITPYRYIGSDWNNNPDYYGSNKELKEDIKKLGKKHFQKHILMGFSKKEITNKELRLKESEILKEKNVKVDQSYYNQSDLYAPGGGIKGMKMPPRSKEHLENWKRSRTGSKHSNSTKKLMSETRKGKSWEERWGKDKAQKEKDKRKGQLPTNTSNWTVISPTGDIFDVFNLKAWCRDKGINYLTVYHQHKGWRIKKND